MGKTTKVLPMPGAAVNDQAETDHSSGAKGQGQELTYLQRVKHAITGNLEKGFYRLGLCIGRHPERFIVVCVLVCSLSSLGLLAFTEVADPDSLWVPKDAQVLKDKEWVEQNFASATTREQMLAESTDILTPTGMAALMDLYENSLTMATSSGITLSDVCIKAGSICVVYSILEIWGYDPTTIRSLTQDHIISAVNTVTTSPVYGNTIDVTKYLGSPVTNSSGSIISAQAAVMTWFTAGDGDMEEQTESWENEFINLGLTGHPDITTLYVMARKSFQEEARKAAYSDAVLLVGGHFIVIGFVVSVLGNFNFMEQKMWLTLAGFISIGLAELVSISLSSALGQGYGPIQAVLPFLLLGLGVDDMFVIIRALNCLSPEEQALDIPHKMAAVLRQAGVSITVTSLTDFVAFIIGATTIIPALQSFCVYAAFGVATLYILQATFFTSFLTIDLRRLQKQRDACLFCCVSHPSPPYTPNKYSKMQFIPFVFKRGLAKVITKWPVKVVVLLVSGALVSVSITGLVKLEQFFDRNWLLTDDSYAKSFIKAMERHFPEEGLAGYVFCGNVDYWSRQTEFEALSAAMTSSSVIYESSTDSWFSALTTWLSTTSDSDVTSMLDSNNYPVSKAAFMNLTYKMTTEIHTRTNAYIVFSSSSELDIAASLFPFRHIQLNDPSTQIEAMEGTRSLVKAAGFSSSECFPFSNAYLVYETNKVIRQELYRNIGLALIAVFIVTMILIANVRTSLLVFFTVLCTLVEVAGTMYFWDLTIDTVTSIILIVSVGLSVDYSAHIGHMFMTLRGSRNERTIETISEMSPAVFYGGFSTFLAFSLLIVSDSYIFTTFFELNFLVVLYGLFNGLVLLPVLLSWFGSEPHATPPDDPGVTSTPRASPAPVKKEGTVNGGLLGSKSDRAPNNQARELTQQTVKEPLAVISLEEEVAHPNPGSTSSPHKYSSPTDSTVDMAPVQT